MSTLKESQLTMARFLRNPEAEAPPQGIELRRLKIYQDLIFNNIEGFISSGFPVLRSLYTDENWKPLVQSFIDGHRCKTPYFMEISQEFLKYLMERHRARPCDPAFIAELAHYEWVELALDISTGEIPDSTLPEAIMQSVPCLSGLAWLLAYQYPVHRIGKDFQPSSPSEPVYLLVYRNAEDEVKFMELNAATARLLELIRDNQSETLAAILQVLAVELGMSLEAIESFAQQQVIHMAQLSIVGFKSA